MKKYKINYTSLRGLKASTFIKASNAGEALRTFKEKFSSYKASGVSEVI